MVRNDVTLISLAPLKPAAVKSSSCSETVRSRDPYGLDATILIDINRLLCSIAGEAPVSMTWSTTATLFFDFVGALAADSLIFFNINTFSASGQSWMMYLIWYTSHSENFSGKGSKKLPPTASARFDSPLSFKYSFARLADSGWSRTIPFM